MYNFLGFNERKMETFPSICSQQHIFLTIPSGSATDYLYAANVTACFVTISNVSPQQGYS